MRHVRIFELANEIKGNFVEVGFGKGTSAKEIFFAMNNGTLTRRDSTLVDSFEGLSLPTPVDLEYDDTLHEGQDPGRYQVAMDMRYELGNHNSISVLKAYTSQYMVTLYNKETIACLHIDLPSFSAIIQTLDLLTPFLNRDAVVYISGYNESLGVTRAVDRYIEDNELQYQFFTKNGIFYIKNKIAPVFYKFPNTTREIQTPEEFIKVSKPKKLAFLDRYIKPIINKFKPTRNTLSGVTNINLTPSKSTITTPENNIPVSKVKVTPFEDRYEKVQKPKFKPTPTVVEGLNVVDKKVSR